eukprot:gene21600-27638_t
MNPFKRVPLYTNQILEVYYNSGLLKSQGIESGTPLSPHVYAIADSAYREMMRAIMTGYGSNLSSKSAAGVGGAAAAANHSILISGESGAGKTESTKIVLRYLTTVGNSSGGLDTLTGSVMDKVLQSNPILEAFGNAKTLRNDNSSRFGKFIELNFNKRGHLIGSRIKTYLLEKVRLPSQQRGERNFHVFYQILAGATVSERERWCLKSVEEFIYTAQGGVFQLRDMDDGEGFQELRQGLQTLNFRPEDQSSLFDIVAGLLHLGQAEFQAVFDAEGEGSSLSDAEDCSSSVATVAALFGLSVTDIIHTLTVRTIVAREETYVKKLTPVQASDARDAVAKAIYKRLFNWIVYTINLSIQVDPKQVRANIGVLDIFGFECFVNNSFEQLCINYTNETLQQQFNQYIFKLEQVEYQNEKIEWSFIEFPDNQDCLDLIEHKLNGILAMIDDECRLPKAADEKLASRMYKALESHSRFSATAPQKRDFKFCIKHYAGNVVYSTITFVEKNKDELPKEASTLLQGSSVQLLSELFSVFGGPASSATQDKLSYLPGSEPQSRRPSQMPIRPQQKSGAAVASSSVASQFKGQLVDLMDSIRSTIPHYIRCLKPNDQNISDNFNRIRITEQLRYGGVLEAVRVARSGFPVRLTHSDFYARYRSLANPFHDAANTLPAFIVNKQQTAMLKELCDLLLQALWDETIPSAPVTGAGPVKASRRQSKLDDLHIWRGKGDIARESVQMGLTKVFLRKPAHDVLESRRSRRMVSAARRIQSTFRCFRVCSRYQRIQRAVRLFQRVGRGMIARGRAHHIRMLHSASLIQTHVRRYLARWSFLRMKSAIVSIQMLYRGKRSLKLVQVVRSKLQSIQLQRFLRGLSCRFRYNRLRYAVIVLQNRSRKLLAKEKLKSLRVAAKDVGKLRQSNDALKLEIETLKAKAVEETRRLRVDLEQQMQAQSAQTQVDELNSLRAELQETRQRLETERSLRQEAEWAFAASEEKLSSCELRLALVLRNVSEEVGDQASVLKAESKLLLSENALQVATRATRSGSMDKSSSSTKIGSPTSLHAPLQSPGGSLSSPSAANKRKQVLSVRTHGASPDLSSPSSRAQQSNVVFVDNSFASSAAAAAADEKYREAIDALEKEAYARQVLEEEVSRLRQLSMEYKAQADSLKRNNVVAASNSSITTSPPAVAAGNMRRFASTSNVLDARRRTSTTSGPAPPVVQRVAEEPAQWGKAWDDEDSSSNGDTGVASPRSSISDGASIHGNNPLMAAASSGGPATTASTHQSAEITSAVTTFEKNLDLFRSKLKQGVKAQFWEGQKIFNAEILLKLDPSSRLVVFEAIQNNLSDIIECLPGAEVKSDTSTADQSLLLTVVTKMDQRGASRILALRFASRDQRNSILSGLRTLIADLHVNSSSSSASSKQLAARNSITSSTAASKTSVRAAGVSDSASSSGSAIGAAVNPMARPVRKLSVREATLEERKAGGASQHRGSVSGHEAAQEDSARIINGVKRQLVEEKEKHERMTIQMLILTNDLNERDEQIAALKKKEEQFEQMLVDRDNMFKQDAMVRMQLGKRLEQVLMDKEEAMEQLELMKEQVESIKSSFASLAR